MRRRLLQSNYRLKAERERTPFGEIDLWFRTPDGRGDLLVEVKSLKHDGLVTERLGARQWRRLSRVLSWVAEKSVRVRLIVVFVRPDGSMFWLGLEECRGPEFAGRKPSGLHR